MSYTPEQTEQIIKNKQLVDECLNAANNAITSRLKDRSGKDAFLIYGRVVLALFSVHFGAMMDIAESKQTEAELTPPRKKDE